MFRILTEDKNRAEVERIVAGSFEGFTVIPATGYWQGQKEQSLAIEVDVPSERKPEIVKVAQAIKTANNQAAVLVEEWPVRSELV
jgi:hypothetical protein